MKITKTIFTVRIYELLMDALEDPFNLVSEITNGIMWQGVALMTRIMNNDDNGGIS